MNRRGFLTSCLALCAAPAIVRADSLMRIVPRETGILRAVDEIAADLSAINADGSYIVFCHPDMERELRAMRDFKGVEMYAQKVPLRGELGTLHGHRLLAATIGPGQFRLGRRTP